MRLLALALLPLPALAAEVRDCEPPADLRGLALPVSESLREFAEGQVALLYLLGEPACCGANLAVLYPDPEVGHTRCALVTTEGGGWSSLDLPAATARYDASQSLVVAVPGLRSTGSGDATVPVTVEVAVDQEVGTVAASEVP